MGLRLLLVNGVRRSPGTASVPGECCFSMARGEGLRLRVIRYVTGFLLMAVAMFYMGETHIWYTEDFAANYPSVGLRLLQPKVEEGWTALQETVEKEKLFAFSIAARRDSLSERQVLLYTTDAARLEAETGLAEGRFDSLFFGSREIVFLPFEQLPGGQTMRIYCADAPTAAQLQAALSPVAELAAVRTGHMPASREKALRVFGIVFSLLLLLTLYEIALRKKEAMVRLLHGAGVGRLIGQGAAADAGVFGGLFALLLAAHILYTGERSGWRWALAALGVFLLFNSLLYLWLLRVDYRRDLTTKQSVRRVLRFSYIYLALTAAVSVSAMSGSLSLLRQNTDFYRQRAFFQQQEGRVYVSINDPSFEKTEAAASAFYQRMAEQGRTLALVDVGKWELESVSYVFADAGAWPVLADAISNLGEPPDSPCYLVPSTLRGSEAALREMREVGEAYGLDPDGRVLWYDAPASLPAVRNQGGVESTIFQSPIVLCATGNDAVRQLYLSAGTMYQVTETEWTSFLAEQGLQPEACFRTGVYEDFQLRSSALAQGLRLATLSLLVLLLLEGAVVYTILRGEFELRSMRFALKKLGGYGFLGRYGRLVGTVPALGLAGILAAMGIGHILDLGIDMSSYWLAGLLVITLGVLLTLCFLRRMERRSLARILKGGGL